MKKNFQIIFYTALLTTSAFAAGDGHGSPKDLIWPFINFTLLVSFIVYKMKKPLSESFTKNAIAIESQYKNATSKSKEVNLKHQEIIQKLNNLNSEKMKIANEMDVRISSYSKEFNVELAQKIEKIKDEAQKKVENERKVLSLKTTKAFANQVVLETKEKVAQNPSQKKSITENLLKEAIQ